MGEYGRIVSAISHNATENHCGALPDCVRILPWQFVTYCTQVKQRLDGYLLLPFCTVGRGYLSLFFYVYLCWSAFWLIRGTAGAERVFMVGWFAGILVSPFRMLRPHWTAAVVHIATIGLAVALLAALALLLKPSTAADQH